MPTNAKNNEEQRLTEYDRFEVELLLRYHNAALGEERLLPYGFRILLLLTVLAGLFLRAVPVVLLSLHMAIGWAGVGLWFRAQKDIKTRLKMLEEALLAKLDDSPKTSLYAELKYQEWKTPELLYLSRYEPLLWGVINTLIVLVQLLGGK